MYTSPRRKNMKNYKRKNISPQDFMLVKAVKKWLLKTDLKPVTVQGFVPIWSQQLGKFVVSEFEPAQPECFILSVSDLRSISSSIRKDKPVAEIKFTTREGLEIVKPIADIAVSDLINALKNLSLILFSAADETKWFHHRPDGKQVALKAEQLSKKGRISKVPLRDLLTKYCKHITHEGETNWDLDRQLLNEHRLLKADVDHFADASTKLKTLLKNCGKNKEAKSILINKMESKIEDYCDAIKRGDQPKLL